MEGNFVLNFVLGVTILFLLIILAILIFHYRNLKFVTRYFLHDIGNYLTSMLMFEEAGGSAQQSNDRNVMLNRLKNIIHLFSIYLKNKSLYEKKVDEVDLSLIMKKHKEKILEHGKLEKRFNWKFEIPNESMTVRTNMHLLVSLLNNCFFNILKYAKEGGEVNIVLRESDQNKNMIELYFENEKKDVNKPPRKGGLGLKFIKKFSSYVGTATSIHEEGNKFKIVSLFKKNNLD